MRETYEGTETPKTAQTVINKHIEQGGYGEDVMARIRREAKLLEEAEEQRKALAYVDRLSGEIRGSVIATLDPGIGGLYDGTETYITSNVLYVDEDTQANLDEAEQILDHEKYHEKHKHLVEMQLGDSAEGETVVTIGGVEFTQEAIIEGITVENTGNVNVSNKYLQYQEMVQYVSSNVSGMTREKIEYAINTAKDLSLIDDESRKRKKMEKEEYQLSL